MPIRRCDASAMPSGAPLVLLALALAAAAATAAAAPAHFYQTPSEVVPQKRAALVLDRILVALQKALREEPRVALADSGPRASALRVPYIETNDMSALQRRGQGGTPGRGRVLRCYFNAVTCF